MRKKLLSIFFVMFLMLLLSPETAQASEISYVAQIGGNNYNTLEDAIAAVPEGNTIKLLEDIILVDTVEITRSVHFQLNLNGKKLYGEGIEGSAINLQSNKELWIYDNSVDGGGTITGTIEVGTSEITYCNLKLEDVTVQSNSNTTILIQRGIVEVTNSSVINTSNNSAIHNFAGRVIVRSGTVKNTSDGRAINNLGGRVDVEGGSVEANTGTAIYNLDTGTIFISGSALITSANTNINEGTIFQQNQPGLTAYNTFLYICGGTIANTAETGTAIYNASAGTIQMQDITTGSVVISGGGVAMNKAPYLAGYTVKISASATNTNGTGASAIRRMVIADNITSYKYLKFEKAPYAAQIGATCYPTLQAAFAAVETNQTINLLEDIYLIGPVTIAEGISKSFTLNLNGKTLSSYQSSIRHLGNGTLIITDTGGGGIITTDDISGYQVPIYIKGGNLAISGGTVDGVIGDTIRNEGTGTVSVSGGTVRNNKQYAISSTAGGKITISGSATVTSASHETANRSTISQTGGTSPEAVVLEITGGTIENTSEFGRAICVRGSGIISISGGQVIADKGAAVWTLNTEKVFISGTATLKNKSTYSGNGTLRMENQIGNASTLEITGGTIENQDGQAIYIYANCNVDIVIPSGRSIIRGGSNAVSKAPNFSSYTDVQVKACTDYDGGTEAAYDSKNIDSYKYLAFTPRTATTVSNLSLNDKLPAPVTGDTPATTYINDAQYTGTYTWPEVTGSKFIGSRSYTATVTLTAAEGYTFSGLEANSFEFTDAVVTHDKGIGNILIVNIKFPYTAPRTLESIEISNQPIKTVYKYGETFSKEGMIVKAFYNDDTIGENYTQYKWDKAFPLVMDDTTVTITDKVITSISATLNITVIKADGPAAPTGLAGVAPTTLGGADGKITGTTALMEYDYLISFTGPADCTETETTGLPAGNYYVRMKATTTHEAGAYWIVIVPAGVTTIAIPTPNSGLSWNNSEQTGVNSGTGYTLSGTDKATAVGNYTAIATLQPGYIWNDSTTTEKTISWSIAKADGPIVPTDLVGVAPTTFGGTDGKITGTTTLMEYADNTEFTSAIECSSTEITGLLAGTYYVRIKSTDTHEAGAYATVNVLVGVTTIAIPMPNSGLKWNNSEQTGVNSGTGYTLSGTDKARAVGNYTATATLQPGYVWNDSTTTEKTISWSIEKADGPAINGVSAVGCTTPDNNDGKLIGMTTAMEYKKIGDASYTAVSGSAISVSGSAIIGLTNSDYLVRFAETETHNAGPDSTFTVASFIPAPTYTISGYIKGSDTNSGIAGACVQLKSGSGNIGSSVFTDSSGAYTISGVSTGTYSIEVSANGYDIDTISSFNLSDANITGKNLTLIKTVILIPVTDIIMNNSDSVQVGTNLTLTGIITPTNATNRTITWSVENENGTGAIITGNTFRATSAGTVTVKVTVINGSSTSSDYNKTFTITAIAESTPDPNPDPAPSPIPSPTPSPIEKPEGTVETDKQHEDGAPAVDVNNSSDELKTSVLTPQEQEMVTRGENAKIILKVTDISASVTDEEKKLIYERLALENGAVENGASDISILYVDLSLYKQVGSQEQIKVTETNSKISISIEVPEILWNTDITKNRAFYTVRIHDGEVTRIDGSYDADKHIFTFETDRFSTYALTYQDSSRIQTYDDFRQLHLKAKADKSSITLSYKRVINVDGYLIYGGKCGEEMTKLAEVPAKTISYTVKSLKPGTYYKYQVKAYRIIDGEQVIIMTSKVAHSITESKTYSNPTKVTSDSTSVRLEAGEAKTVTCQVVLPKGKKLKEHTAAIRYESSNKAIATVNSKGTITAKEKGSCYVYAYAQNGVYKRIKVTVK